MLQCVSFDAEILPECANYLVEEYLHEIQYMFSLKSPPTNVYKMLLANDRKQGRLAKLLCTIKVNDITI